MDNAAANLKKKRMTKHEVTDPFPFLFPNPTHLRLRLRLRLRLGLATPHHDRSNNFPSSQKNRAFTTEYPCWFPLHCIFPEHFSLGIPSHDIFFGGKSFFSYVLRAPAVGQTNEQMIQVDTLESRVVHLTDENDLWKRHFVSADMVIEAVPENMDLKHRWERLAYNAHIVVFPVCTCLLPSFWVITGICVDRWA